MVAVVVGFSYLCVGVMLVWSDVTVDVDADIC